MKLFRKLRFSSIKKEKIGSYLSYALGEVVLVVFGILIAVYINNKNEESKQLKELYSIFSIIKNDLKNDIKEAEDIISYEEEKKELYNAFFSKKFKRKDYEENYNLRKLIFGYPEISFNQRGFKLLNEFKNSNKSKDSLTIKIIELYTHRIDEVKADDKLRDLEFQETYNKWKHQDWWYDYIEGLKNKETFTSSKFIDYALESQDYKNRVTSWHFVSSLVFIPEIKEFVKEAEEILTLIKLRKSKK